MTLPEAPGHPAAAGSVPSGQAGDATVAVGPDPSGAGHVVLDRIIRVAGGLLSVLLALLTAVAELMLAQLRVAGVLIGVSALLAVVLNIALAWFAVATVGRRWAVCLPAVPWTLLMFIAASVRTDEGDQMLLGNSWVGLAMILLGSVSFAGYAYRLILRVSPPM